MLGFSKPTTWAYILTLMGLLASILYLGYILSVKKQMEIDLYDLNLNYLPPQE